MIGARRPEMSKIFIIWPCKKIFVLPEFELNSMATSLNPNSGPGAHVQDTKTVLKEINMAFMRRKGPSTQSDGSSLGWIFVKVTGESALNPLATGRLGAVMHIK